MLNKEITEWLSLDDSGGHLVQFLLKQGHPEQVAQSQLQIICDSKKLEVSITCWRRG